MRNKKLEFKSKESVRQCEKIKHVMFISFAIIVTECNITGEESEKWFIIIPSSKKVQTMLYRVSGGSNSEASWEKSRQHNSR